MNPKSSSSDRWWKLTLESKNENNISPNLPLKRCRSCAILASINARFVQIYLGQFKQIYERVLNISSSNFRCIVLFICLATLPRQMPGWPSPPAGPCSASTLLLWARAASPCLAHCARIRGRRADRRSLPFQDCGHVRTAGAPDTIRERCGSTG